MDLAGYRPTLGEVAALFGKSSRWISDLRAKGEMPGDGATLKEFVDAWLSQAGAANGIKAKPIELARARRELAKAEREEIQTATLKGEMLPRDVVTHAVQSAFARCRARLLGLPAKIAPIVASMKSAVAIQEKLTELVHEALAELAATQVGVAVQEGGESGAGAASGDVAGDGDRRVAVVAGDDAAAATDGERMGGPEPGAKPGRKRRAR